MLAEVRLRPFGYGVIRLRDNLGNVNGIVHVAQMGLARIDFVGYK